MQQVLVVEGCVNMVSPDPHRVRIMAIVYDTRVGARLAQVRITGGVTSVTRPSLFTARYHERTVESASMRAPRVGSASPKGEAAEESRHTKGTGPLAWDPGHREKTLH